ncbi:MAG: gliding motility-associated ABC transporter ATP-binding subunit GldA [Mesonia hippocampi]|uniref:gliding motility-associated ABC transporter ATP-binding subunit GldA n=1 Tax=Mesonia hippocampi TaxID=1628250 RepID=UPI003F9BC18E
MGIEVKNIAKYYGDQQALNDVSFSVGKGEIVGFLGPNGAGKSTMMKILTGYITPDKGEAFINGNSVKDEIKKVQQEIGYLPEHNPLYLEMYVREYLNFLARIHRVPQKRIAEVIQLTGLTPEANKKIEQLSKGYRQRVGIAAALLHDPKVLILDEPTTGLDPNQLVEIRNLIKKVGKEKTIFLSTHIMQEVEALCERVVIINKGCIVTDKKLADLKGSEEQILRVEFDYRIETVALQRLEHLLEVVNVDGFLYELSFSTTTDMRSAVFDFAHDNGLKILQLHQKHENLEELFRKLTVG